MKKALFRLQYELGPEEDYTEQGVDRGAKLAEDAVGNAEVKEILDATSTLAPTGTSSTMTAISPSMSMPQASSAMTMGSRGPRKESEPP